MDAAQETEPKPKSTPTSKNDDDEKLSNGRLSGEPAEADAEAEASTENVSEVVGAESKKSDENKKSKSETESSQKNLQASRKSSSEDKSDGDETDDDDDVDDDDDDDENNDPYCFSEDEEGSSMSSKPFTKVKKEKREDSDDDRPYSSGSLGEEDRLVIAEDFLVKKEDPDGLNLNLKKEVTVKKERKKQNRFNGLTEEELSKRLLPDLIAPNLDILIIGINPGMYAAYKGHHYAGPGNHFWKCMYLSGLLPRPMCSDDDKKLLDFGIGFTNIVERTTRGSANLSRQEIVEGSKTLVEKIKQYKPKIAVFNGKGIYEVFSSQKTFPLGKQAEKFEGTDTYIWVMPNSSARCAQLPRAIDKVPFFAALKKFRDFLTGKISEEDFDEQEVVFSDVKLKNFESPEKKALKALKKIQMNYEFKLPDDGPPVGDGDDVVGVGVKSEFPVDADGAGGKKRRGRPPKPRPDGTLPPPKRRRVDADGMPLPRGTNPIDPLTGKKKRGRPKKSETSDSPTKEGKPRQSKKKQMMQTNGFEKRDSTDSAFYGNPGYPDGMPADLNETKNVKPLPPFSPNFRRGSAGAELSSVAVGEEPNAVEPKISPKRDQSCSESPPDATLPHSQPQMPLDYGRQMMGMDSSGRVDNMESEEERRRRKYRICDYPAQPQNDSGSEQELHLGHHQQHHHQQQQQQQSQQQQQYPSPSRYVNYSPSPVVGKSSASAASRTPTHSYSPGNGAYGYANGASGNVHHPSASPYDRSSHSAAPKSAGSAEDVASKSITGLESLVDQIPASMSENDSGVFMGSGAGSHPNTPRSVGPYSPAASQFHPSPFHPSSGGSAGTFVPPQNHFVPSTSDTFASDHSSTNYSSGSTSGPTDFSVNSLVHNSSTSNSSNIATVVSEAAVAAAASLAATASPHFSVSDSFSVSSLTSSYDMASKYSGLPSASPGNPYMQPGMFGSSAAASFGGGFLGQGIGSGSFMNPGSMANAMGMGAMSYYGPYSNTYSSAAAQSPGFTASPYAHGLHMPNPSYPYAAYGQSPYSQSPYF